MTIEKLVDGYSQLTNEELKEKYLTSNIKIKPYVSFATKVEIAKRICETTMYDDRHDVVFNSPITYLLYTLNVIDLWTDLDIDFTGANMDILTQYDRLRSNGLIEKIETLIPESELSEFIDIFEMTVDDIRKNDASLQDYIEKLIVRLGKNIGDFIAPILDQLEQNGTEQSSLENE